MPQKSSFAEYRQRVSSNFFKDIFEEDFKRLEAHRQTFKGLYVYAIDGDDMDLPASEDLFSSGFKGYPYSKLRETYYPKMYSVQALDIINGMVKEFDYLAEKNEIRLARSMVKNLEKNSLTIYDRLHGSYETVRTHTIAKNFFLIRVRNNNPKIQFAVKEFCSSMKRSSFVDLKANRDESRNDSSLIPIKVRLVKIRNPRAGKDIVFMTNLPEEKMTNKEIGLLYQRRWEVEVSFRDLTSTLKMNQWHSLKLNGILQEIFALLWLVNQIRITCSQMTFNKNLWLGQTYEKVNFKLAMQIATDHLHLIVTGKSSRLGCLLDFWLKRSTEKRRHLSRSYPRQIKGYPKPYISASSVLRRAA